MSTLNEQSPDTRHTANAFTHATWPGFWSFLLVLCAVALAGLSLVILVTAFRNQHQPDFFHTDLITTFLYSPTTAFCRRQAVFFLVACFAGAATWLLPLRFLYQCAWLLFIGAVGVLAIILFKVPGITHTAGGACRWLGSPSLITVQGSDVAKIAFVLALARLFTEAQRFFVPVRFKYWRLAAPAPEKLPWFKFPTFTADAWRDILRGFLCPALLIGVVTVFIALEPDLGSAIIFALVGGLLLFLAGARLRYVLPTVPVVIAALAVVIVTWPEKLIRVTTFMDPAATRADKGRQIWECLVAFSRGGETGVGFGNGIQHEYFLPEAHTDCIFAILGEQGGLVTTGIVAGIFLLMFVIVAANLWRARNIFQFTLCLGSLLFIVVQALVNMCVVTDMIPTTGVPLPFVSYGGTSLIINFALLGLILNCFRRWSKPVSLQDALT